MDTEARRLKKLQLEQWEATKNRLENGGLTINIGTGGGRVSKSDISINDIRNADRQIEQIRTELDEDAIGSIEQNYLGLLEMMIMQAQRQDDYERNMIELDHKMDRVIRRISPDARERTGSAVSILFWAVALYLAINPVTFAYGIANPFHAIIVLVPLVLLGSIVRWLPGDR